MQAPISKNYSTYKGYGGYTVLMSASLIDSNQPVTYAKGVIHQRRTSEITNGTVCTKTPTRSASVVPFRSETSIMLAAGTP